VDGDAYMNNRKGKHILVYDLEVKVDWTGKIVDDSGNTIVKAEGSLNLSGISEENDLDEFQIEMTCTESTDGAVRLKEVLKKDGFGKVRETIVKFLKELQTGGGMLEEGVVKRASESKSHAELNSESKKVLNTVVSTDSSSSVSADGRIKLTCEFRAKPSDIFECFLDPRRVSAYTQSQAQIRPEVGSAFSIYGGLVTGEITALESNEKIEMKWRINSWPTGIVSTVAVYNSPHICKLADRANACLSFADHLDRELVW